MMCVDSNMMCVDSNMMCVDSNMMCVDSNMMCVDSCYAQSLSLWGPSHCNQSRHYMLEQLSPPNFFKTIRKDM